MMHARPEPPRTRPVLAVTVGVLLLSSLGTVAWMAAARGGGEPQAAPQTTPVPQDTPTAPDPQSVCEERVVDLLYTYGQDRQTSSQVTTLTPDQVATTTLRQRTIYLHVLGDYDLMLSRGTDMVKAIQAVDPRVKQGCARASSSDQ